ncbi:MAG: response regulator [Candidatus Helarchaeota archaeon]
MQGEKPRAVILVVEDNADVRYNLKLTLEFNNYEVITANDGAEGLKKLSVLKDPPDLIISDIMMPEMNGYDFFKKVSENPAWNSIPFIFLTARTSPKDVRFGKMLGVDDYIIKPFKEDDLLASIAGKIIRNQKANILNRKIDELFSNYAIETKASISIDEKSSILLLFVLWDDKSGPTLKDYYPRENRLQLPPTDIGFQLFSGAVSIYGQSSINQAQGMLLNIENIKQQGYIYFDSILDNTARGKERPFMLGIIAPKINYFETLKFNLLFKELSEKIKQDLSWTLGEYWQKIVDILTNPLL